MLDRVVGQPRLHPVRAIGSLLDAARRRRRARSDLGALCEGAAAVVGVAALGAAVAGLLGGRRLRRAIGRPGAAVVEAVALQPALALEALLEAGAGVAAALRSDDLPTARQRLARDLVSRDTSALDERLVASAAIESMAENFCDSVVAPVCAFLVGGLPGAWAYRVVNTADAMFGYRTPDLFWYGKSAARADDVLNLVPARLSALLLLGAGTGRIAGSAESSAALRFRRVLDALPEEARRAAGPNAGWPMAAAALLLGVRLEKPGVYVLNAAGAAPRAADIERAAVLIRRAAWLAVALAAAASLPASHAKPSAAP